MGIGLLSCYSDNGNYNYLSGDQVGEIRIDTVGVKNKNILNSNLLPGTHVDLELNVKYKYPERLQYRWFYLPLNSSSFSYNPVLVGNASIYPKGDTIYSKKRLEWDNNLDGGVYRFYFMAKDSITGQKAYYQFGNYTTITLSGTQDGLYMLSEYDGNTDIDIYCSDLMLVSGSDAQYPKYYSKKTGNVISGKPLFIKGSHTGKTSKDGYIICTDKTILRLNQVGLAKMDDWNSMFYETPSTYNPQNLFFVNNCESFINDGKLHLLYTNKANNRKLSVPIAGDYEASDYLAHATKSLDEPVTGAINPDQIIYDKKNKRFCPYFAYQSAIGSFKSTSGSAYLDANKLPANPIAIFNGYGERTYCIVPVNEKYYLYRFNFYNRVDNGDLSADGAASITDLSGCTDISKARYFTANKGGHAFFYATDKAAYSFSPSTGQTTSYTFYTCQPNEEITCIYTWNGEGWPTECVIFWIALWDSAANSGKLLEYEIDNNAGKPQQEWGPMFGIAHDNPYVTTGWGKIKSMTHIYAE